MRTKKTKGGAPRMGTSKTAIDERKFRGVSIRTDDENRFEGRLDRVAEELSKRFAGVTLKRAAAARAVFERGLASLEQELGLA